MTNAAIGTECEITDECMEKEPTDEEKKLFRYFIECSHEDKTIKIGSLDGSNCITLNGVDDVKTFIQNLKDCCRNWKGL